jgi:hypothetical protein
MNFKKGDFVRVVERTHDKGMPASRLGHIIEEHKEVVHYTNKEKVSTGVWKVFMTNGVILKFHGLCLEHADGINRQREEID